MEFKHLIALVGDEPVFETGLLLAGEEDPDDVQRQLSRWVKAGQLYQLRRGLYAFAPPFQKSRPHPFVVANHLVRGSYVSLQSALAHEGLIPEVTPRITSITTGRPNLWETALGTYEFRRIKAELFLGYRRKEVSPGQHAFIATPEKALLDLAYLQPGSDGQRYLQELRLQNLERLDLVALQRLADQAGSPKLRRVAAAVAQLAQAEAEEYETL